MTPFGDTKFHSGVSLKNTQKKTSERKEGEEALVESQGEKKNLQFHSKGKIRSNSLFVAIVVVTAVAQEPSLERSFACSRAQSASSTVHHCSSIWLGPNLDLLLRARH
jgi:hypothetical protein